MKKPSAFSLPVLFLGLNLLTASALQADVLASYTFTAATGNPTTLNADLSDGVLSWNPGGSNFGFSSGTNSAYVKTASAPSSFDSNVYLEFTVTANGGIEFSLDSLVFDLGGQNYEAEPTYTVNANVRSSVDAYAADIQMDPGTVTTATHEVTSMNTESYSTFTVDLSGSQYNNLDEITLRLYPSDNDLNGNIYRYANITLNGTTAVIPEPGTAILVLLSALGMIFCIRRKNG